MARWGSFELMLNGASRRTCGLPREHHELRGAGVLGTVQLVEPWVGEAHRLFHVERQPLRRPGDLLGRALDLEKSTDGRLVAAHFGLSQTKRRPILLVTKADLEPQGLENRLHRLPVAEEGLGFPPLFDLSAPVVRALVGEPRLVSHEAQPQGRVALADARVGIVEELVRLEVSRARVGSARGLDAADAVVPGGKAKLYFLLELDGQDDRKCSAARRQPATASTAEARLPTRLTDTSFEIPGSSMVTP